MLTITLPGTEFWDEEKEEFITQGDLVLRLEHSLVTLSKWESIHEKPFLTEDAKSTEETLSYVKCMIQGDELSPEDFDRLDEKAFEKINAYIDSKQTATWFHEEKHAPRSRETITSELIYFWMTSFQIPWEAQYWHLNRLFTLLKVHNVKNEKPKKRNPQQMAAERARLNAERQAQYGTKG